MARGNRAAAKGSHAAAGRAGRRRQPAAGSSAGVERVTRSSKAKLTNGLEDPAQVEKELNAQLRSMGLYAANITGDGNCLFRALSDQLYGFPAHHAELRHNVCDYLEAKPEKFAGFIDVEKPFEEYVRTMRLSGTYGGHLELSAFAQLKQKEIKIVQPGLVYVLSPGSDDDSPQAVREREQKERERERAQAKSVPGSEGPPLTQRALRKMRREKKGVGTSSAGKEPSDLSLERDVDATHVQADDAQSTESAQEVDKQTALASSAKDSERSTTLAQVQTQQSARLEQTQPQLEAYGPLWIAYHNWEHYSSIRNIDGPHSGLPRIKDRGAGRSAHAARSDGRQNADAESEEESDHEPNEEEELVLRSTRGYNLQQVRFYIKRHGGWEEALEAILAQEAVKDDDEEDVRSTSPKSAADTTDSALTPARVPSPSSLGGSQATLQQLAHLHHQDSLRNSPVPDRLREWRNASPSSVDTNGTHSSLDGASTSTHATTDDAHEASSLAPSSRGEVRRSKRTASKDPTSNLRSSKRRSRSRSPLQQSFGAESPNDLEGAVAARAIANISVDGDQDGKVGSDGSASPAPAHRSGHQGVDPDKTPRQHVASSMGSPLKTRTATRTLTVRERREMRKAEKVRRALDTRAKQEKSQGLRGAPNDDDFEDEDEENAPRNRQVRSLGALKGHGADVKGFLELKI